MHTRCPVELVGDVQTTDLLGESPVWCSRRQTLYWVDVRAPALRLWKPATGETRSWRLPDLCGAVMLSDTDALVLAMRTAVGLFDPADATFTPLLTPEPTLPGNRLNDSKCDRHGRLWVSSMNNLLVPGQGSLYRIGSDLSCTRMLSGISVPNSLAFSPDNRTLYFADSPESRIRAYEFEATDGSLGGMTILIDKGRLPGDPDGSTVDADGCIWTARYGGSCVARVTPDGAIDRVIDLPVTQVACCTFGGPDLSTLYITTATQRLTSEQLGSQPLAGRLFAVRPGVSGLAEPAYRVR